MTAQDKALKENTASAPLQIVAPGTCVETGEQATLVLGMYDHLVETIHQYNPSADFAQIDKAFRYADTHHNGQLRKDGSPFITHPLAVAQIIAEELRLDSESIEAALMHDCIEDTSATYAEIAKEFSPAVADLVEGVSKLTRVQYASKEEEQMENLRKMLMAMAKDIRVILIKLADRTHNMRTMEYQTAEKQRQKSLETMEIYAPIAHRLGMQRIKWELEDLSLKYLDPVGYDEITRSLAAKEAEHEAFMERVQAQIEERLKEQHVPYLKVYGRMKHPYSIYRKMYAQNKTMDEVLDLFAFRVIVDTVADCYNVLGIIHDLYRPILGRFKDYIAMPKQNMYQSLHTTLIGPSGQPFEIQIRTFEMHRTAEYGIAAHWKYKESNVEEDTELDKWIQTITEILESPDPNALDFLDTIKLNLFTSEIFVFTPKGDIKTLPQGATALDFAYALHSDIGNKCIGAKVNHRLVPLSHPLSSGDQVEVLTSRSQEPQPEWLNFVTTAKARAKIDAVLKRVRKEVAKYGEIKVLDAFKRSELEASTSNLDKLGMYFGFSKREEFFYAVEKGDVVLPENLKKLLKEKTDNVLFKYVKQALGVASKKVKQPEEEETKKEKPKYDKKKPYLLKEEAFERNYVIAECCKPIPGDDSLGFINDDGNVVVHKRSCPIAMRLKSSFGERILNTVWSSHMNASFEATLEVKGIDSIGVLNTITKTISEDFNVNIMRLLIEAKDGVFEGKIKMKVHDVEDIQKMCVTLSKIQNIKSVGRVAD